MDLHWRFHFRHSLCYCGPFLVTFVNRTCGLGFVVTIIPLLTSLITTSGGRLTAITVCTTAVKLCYLLVVYVLWRVNGSRSFFNSHLYQPRCISHQRRLPAICQCGTQNISVCQTEWSGFGSATPTVTYVTSLTGVCISTTTRYSSAVCTGTQSLSFLLSSLRLWLSPFLCLSIRFNSHYPGDCALAGTRMQNLSILDFIGAKDDRRGDDDWSCKTCKAPVKLSPPTTIFLQARFPSCRLLTVSKHWRKRKRKMHAVSKGYRVGEGEDLG